MDNVQEPHMDGTMKLPVRGNSVCKFCVLYANTIAYGDLNCITWVRAAHLHSGTLYLVDVKPRFC